MFPTGRGGAIGGIGSKGSSTTSLLADDRPKSVSPGRSHRQTYRGRQTLSGSRVKPVRPKVRTTGHPVVRRSKEGVGVIYVSLTENSPKGSPLDTPIGESSRRAPLCEAGYGPCPSRVALETKDTSSVTFFLGDQQLFLSRAQLPFTPGFFGLNRGSRIFNTQTYHRLSLGRD